MEEVTRLFKKIIWLVKFIWYARHRYESRQDDHIRGKFYVEYDDGRRSMKMCLWNAIDYANMFGGKVKTVF